LINLYFTLIHPYFEYCMGTLPFYKTVDFVNFDIDCVKLTIVVTGFRYLIYQLQIRYVYKLCFRESVLPMVAIYYSYEW